MNKRNDSGTLSDKYGINMTTPREWPTNAKEARDKASEISVAGRMALEKLIHTEVSEAERMRMIAIAINSFAKITRLMESVGAQTNPIYED